MLMYLKNLVWKHFIYARKSGHINERFPYDYYVPEKVLLDKEELQNRKNISSDIEELLIELSI